jgi:hypothetical protein
MLENFLSNPCGGLVIAEFIMCLVIVWIYYSLANKIDESRLSLLYDHTELEARFRGLEQFVVENVSKLDTLGSKPSALALSSSGKAAKRGYVRRSQRVK